MARQCTVDGCNTPSISKGMCKAHYQRARRGQPLINLRRRDLTPLEVFERYVIRTDECWGWSGPKVPYGTINSGGQSLRAHRFAYEHFVGPIAQGMEVRHTCDNPECSRPDHLVVGTHADNMRDMQLRNRSAKGERNPLHKLTDADVADIRGTYERGGVLCRELAERYGVNTSTISRIVSGKRR